MQRLVHPLEVVAAQHEALASSRDTALGVTDGVALDQVAAAVRVDAGVVAQDVAAEHAAARPASMQREDRIVVEASAGRPAGAAADEDLVGQELQTPGGLADVVVAVSEGAEAARPRELVADHVPLGGQGVALDDGGVVEIVVHQEVPVVVVNAEDDGRVAVGSDRPGTVEDALEPGVRDDAAVLPGAFTVDHVEEAAALALAALEVGEMFHQG